MIHPTLYQKDSNDNVRVWFCESENDKFRTFSGVKTGSIVMSEWTTVKEKNIGKKNYRSANDQALEEIKALYKKKLEHDYYESEEDISKGSKFFAPMLASKFEKWDFIDGPVLSQPKLDGIRCIAKKDGLWSRQGKKITSLTHIEKALAPIFNEQPDAVLDGEAYSHSNHDNFNEIVSIVRKQNPSNSDREKARKYIQFHCYDIVSEAPFKQRYMDVAHMLQFADPCIQIVETSWAHCQEELDSLYSTYLQNNYEGQMVRLTDGGYESDKRSKYLRKRKEFQTEEFELIAVEEGKGNWQGFCKTVTVKLADGKLNDSGVRGNQEFLRNILQNKDKYIGGQVTVRYFGYTVDGQLRFPVVVDWLPEGRVD
jgi:ATP-dependent DNA ligase